MRVLNTGREFLHITCAWAVPFALISLPRFAPLWVGGLPLTGNLDGVRLPPDFAANALRSLLAWVGQPDISPFWLSSQPLLPVFFLLVFLVGVGLCLRRWRDAAFALLPLTLLLTTIAGGVIWPAAPLYVRYLTALPAVALLIALPLNRALAQTGWPRRVAVLLLAALLLQGLVLSIGQGDEARANVQAGVWEADGLAQEAAALSEGVPLVANVSADFSAVERVIFADAVAAYGERRPVRVVSP